MGNFSSQYLEEWANSARNANAASLIQKTDGANSVTPKNKDVRRLPWDPRSPSRSIKRTPIQVEKTPTFSRSKYTPVKTADFSSDENNGLTIDELEGEEATEEYNYESDTTTTTTKYNREKHRCENEYSFPLRSPLKVSSMRNMDSPVMLLRYKQIKGIQHRSAEMYNVARDAEN